MSEPLVLIHGGAGTPRQWKPVMPLLAPRHELLAVRLVGHWGGAPAPPGDGPLPIDVLVDGVEADMDRAGWDSAHVAGTSLGAWVALELAKRGRARTCTALAAAGPWRPRDPRVRLVMRSYGLFQRAARLMARDPRRWTSRPRLRRLLYWHHFARTERMDPADTAHMIEGVAACTVLPRLFAWAREHGGPRELDRIACPVQLLFPAGDLVLPRRRYGESLLRALPHAEVHELPGAGHVATWDDPQAVARAILSFAERHASTPSSP